MGPLCLCMAVAAGKKQEHKSAAEDECGIHRRAAVDFNICSKRISIDHHLFGVFRQSQRQSSPATMERSGIAVWCGAWLCDSSIMFRERTCQWFLSPPEATSSSRYPCW